MFAIAACEKDVEKELIAIEDPETAASKQWLQPRFFARPRTCAYLGKRFEQTLDDENSIEDLAHAVYVCLSIKRKAEPKAAR